MRLPVANLSREAHEHTRERARHVEISAATDGVRSLLCACRQVGAVWARVGVWACARQCRSLLCYSLLELGLVRKIVLVTADNAVEEEGGLRERKQPGQRAVGVENA